MSQAMPIATIRDTSPDEWVMAQVTEVDEAEVPLAGIVLIHSPDQLRVFQAVKAHLAKHPEAELYTFFTGELIPEGLHIAFSLPQADIVLPNSDLINHQVTNWTLANRHARILIPVGVAYGSDVPLVMQLLVACATENDLVMNTPELLVFFRQFGASSLDFELRAWIWDVGNRFRAISELYQEIERRFREAGSEIAFPQRDLHIRSVDTLAASRFSLPLRPDA